MPPARVSKAASTHQNFDIGVTGRRTGVQPPSNVRRDDEGFEDLDAYYGSSPVKKSAVGGSVRKATSGTNASNSRPLTPGREKKNRPDMHHEIGERGRKTGVKAPSNAKRDSAGFEHFADYLDSMSPDAAAKATVTSNKAKTIARSPNRNVSSKADQRVSPADDDGEDDEQAAAVHADEDGNTISMSLADGDEPSPEAYIARHTSTSKRPAFGSARSTRTYTDTELVDFDEVPEPDPSPKRSSGGNRASRKRKEPSPDLEGQTTEGEQEEEEPPKAKRSKTSRKANGITEHKGTKKRATRAISEEVEEGGEELHEGFQMDAGGTNEEEGEGSDGDVFDDDPEDTFDGRRTTTGLTGIPEEEYDLEEEEEDQRDDQEEEDYQEGDDQEKEEEDRGGGDQEEEEEEVAEGEQEEELPLAKNKRGGKGKGKRDESAVHAKTAKRRDARAVAEREPTPPGLRRSTRTRVAPLEYWRNEHIIYQRRASGSVPVVAIAGIFRQPAEPHKPLAKRTYRSQNRATSQAARVKSEQPPPEQGIDDETAEDGEVQCYRTGTKVTQRIAFTEAMLEKDIYDGDKPFDYKSVFVEDYMVAGFVIIPKGKEKSRKATKDHCYIFYVIEGAVKVTLNDTPFYMGPHGSFRIPPGNYYSIANAAQRETRLFYALAKRPSEPELELDEED